MQVSLPRIATPKRLASFSPWLKPPAVRNRRALGAGFRGSAISLLTADSQGPESVFNSPVWYSRHRCGRQIPEIASHGLVRSPERPAEIAQIKDRIKAKQTSIMKSAASANPLPLAIGPVRARRLRIPSGFA
jgi:hypothetical protein